MPASVIIPAYNCEGAIEKCLASLTMQTIKDFEVIVVNDGSTDNTHQICQKFKKSNKHSFDLQIITIKNSGPAKARNEGTKIAKYSILVFTDSDCIPKEDWIEQMILPFVDPKIDGVGGGYLTQNSDKLLARYVGYEIEIRHKNMRKSDYIDFVGTFSAAYRKNIFKKFGGFDESYPNASGEDVDFSFRISKEGHKIVFNKNAIVGHYHPDSLVKYLKQKYIRGKSSIRLYFTHFDKVRKGDSYTPKSILLQLFLAVVTAIAALLVLLNVLSLEVLLVSVFSMFLATIQTTASIAQYEYKLLLIAPFLLILRNYAFILGIIVASINLAFEQFNKKFLVRS